MKIPLLLIAIIGFFGMCTRSQPANTQQVIVVIEGSTEGATVKARQRAAEIVVEQGDRYFVIHKEDRVQVVRAENEQFYGNMYQELIIEGDFGKERLQKSPLPNGTTYPAIRLVFSSYKERPKGRAIDACTLTQCP